jgi:L-threonylcarbamoyladenylate synthase
VKTELLTADSDAHIRRAAELLRRGGLVAFPTDTVYGLGTCAFDPTAVLRIYSAKNRPPEKAIPVLIASLDELGLVAAAPGKTALSIASRFWPGPVTIVVPKHPRVPEAVSGQTVGVRIPDHAVARALLALSGPLAVTSANLSGLESPVTAAQVREQLDGRVDMILDGGITPGGLASTVVDCTGSSLGLVILREGPITRQDLKAALS